MPSKDFTTRQAASGQQKQPLPANLEGLPAITPHLNMSAADATLGLATFDAQDAVTYTIAHPSGINRPTKPVTADDIKVEFMTEEAAGVLLNHIDIGLTPNAIVCVVQTHSTFNIRTPGVAVPSNTRHANKYAANFAYQVFDGRTGNLLVDAGSLNPYIK